jgi:hypothetical protein
MYMLDIKHYTVQVVGFPHFLLLFPESIALACRTFNEQVRKKTGQPTIQKTLLLCGLKLSYFFEAWGKGRPTIHPEYTFTIGGECSVNFLWPETFVLFSSVGEGQANHPSRVHLHYSWRSQCKFFVA